MGYATLGGFITGSALEMVVAALVVGAVLRRGAISETGRARQNVGKPASGVSGRYSARQLAEIA